MTKPNESSSEPPNDPESVSPQEASDSAAGGGWNATGDDLPDLLELTPELVEEEAIRGDFMLRGAAILLAVLLGCGEIADSRVLVHVRSGDDMQANGFLPPRTDVFSFANEGQPAANVSWLFDHVVSVVWSLGGPLGLTVFKALIAGLIAWFLSRISVRGLPTWWCSICGVIALAACASDFMPVTDLVTLLGLVVLLKMLHSAFDGNTDGLIWKAPLLLVIWANMDPHAWLGIAGLFLFSVGRTFARVPGETRPGAAPRTLWMATAVSAVALLINPFPVASILSVVQTYFIEYPGMRAFNPLNETTVGLFDGRTEYYSLFNVETWAGFEFAYVAAIAAILLGVVAVVLARDRREAPWAFLLLGFAGLTVLSIHELSAAALVAAVVAGTVGQRWYQKTFPQEYTIKPSEVLFSRAGRAVTVLCFAVVGFLVVTDRLPTRTPLGSGFTSDLQTTIDAFDRQLSELPKDARVIHTRVDLGDFLIWNGRKSFVDSRITPFGMPDDTESTNQRFRTLRQDMVDAASAVAKATLIAAQPPSATQPEATDDAPDLAELQAELHRELQADGITHAVVALYPPKPHYRSLGALSSDSDSWTLIGLESSAAIFDYTNGVAVADKPEPFNPVEVSFRDVKPENVRRFEFAREQSFYSQYLYNTRPSVSEDLRIARHFLAFQSTPDSLLVAIRAGNRLVSQGEPSADGFYVLALAYSRLAAWENQVATQAGGRFASDMRYLQIVMAARQAVTLNPKMSGAWNLLYQTYSQRGRIDQALECLSEAIPLLEKSLLLNYDENQAKVVAQLSETRQQMAEAVAQIEQQLEEGLSQDLSENPVERTIHKNSIAEQVATRGHIGASLKLLQENQAGLQETPQIFARAEMMRGQLLLETGALQEGYELFMQLNSMAEKESQGAEVAYPWATMAFISQIGLGAYPQAIQEMAVHIGRLRSGSDRPSVTWKILVTLPLVASLETTLRSNATTQWPLSQLVSILNPMAGTPQVQVEPRFIQAMAELESGNLEAARVSFQGLITECGVSPYRPLAAAYLSLLRDDLNDFLMKNTMSPWEEWSESDFESISADAGKPVVSPEPSEDEEASSDDTTADESPETVPEETAPSAE